MITFKTIHEVNNVALINVGCVQIGFLNHYKDYYGVSVLYHSFTIPMRYKSSVRQSIKKVYDVTQNLLEAERLKIPIRINGNLDYIPEGNKNLKIIE